MGETRTIDRITPARRRSFAPWYVTRLGTHFVAVDRFQPVAVSLNVNGGIEDVVSWAMTAAVPERLALPNRRVVPSEDALVVQDLPDGDAVRLELASGGRFTCTTGCEVPDSAPAVYRHLFRPAARTVEAGDPDGHTWHLHSTRDRFALSAAVTLSNSESTRRLDIPRPASVTSLAALGADLAVACVRRADVRPWDFQPETRLWFIRPIREDLIPRLVPALDITDLCWPRPLGQEHALRRQQDLSAYLTYSLGGLRALRDFGADRPELTVHGDVSAGDVTVDLTFGMPHLSGVRLRRRDRPFDERGVLGGGRRELNISLGEDLESGVIEAVAPHEPGVTDV